MNVNNSGCKCKRGARFHSGTSIINNNIFYHLFIRYKITIRHRRAQYLKIVIFYVAAVTVTAVSYNYMVGLLPLPLPRGYHCCRYCVEGSRCFRYRGGVTGVTFTVFARKNGGSVKNFCKNIWRVKKKSLPLHRFKQERALSSAGSERLPYKQRVGGSNPSAPTLQNLLSCLSRSDHYNSVSLSGA